LAHEVAELLPGIVKNAVRAEEVDSLGNVIAERVGFQAINYTGIIPYLVAAMQEQQATIATQNERMARLEQLLAGCCNTPSSDEFRASDLNSVPKDPLNGTHAMLRIQPNPFNQQTTVFYTVERTGRMQLLANSADGKDLLVLDEAQREAGDYQYEWNTSSLAPGMYYVTLLLEGQPVVKKAVKVDR
jgi:hypothetical protein